MIQFFHVFSILILTVLLGCSKEEGEEVFNSLLLGRLVEFSGNIANEGISSNGNPSFLVHSSYSGAIKLYNNGNCSGIPLIDYNVAIDADRDGRTLQLARPLTVDGEHTFSVGLVVEEEEKEQCSPSISYTLDTQAPELAVTSAISSFVSDYVLEGECELGLPVVVYEGGLSGGREQLQCRDRGIFNLPFTLSDTNGMKSIQVQQTDLAGNVATVFHQVLYVVEQTDPLITITSLHYIRSTAYTLTGECEAGLGVSISGSGIVGNSMVAHCVDSDSDTANNDNQLSGTFTQALTLSSGDGSKELLIEQADSYGNTTSILYPIQLITSVDTSFLVFAESGLQNGVSNDNNPGFIADYLPRIVGTVNLYDNGDCTGTVVGTATFTATDLKMTITLNNVLGTDQIYSFSMDTTDSSNNRSPCSNSLSFTFDQTSPVVTMNTLPALTLSGRSAYTVTGTCTLNDGDVSVVFQDGVAPLMIASEASCQDVSSSGQWSAEFDLVDIDLEGASSATVRAIQLDSAGNSTEIQSPALTIPDCVSDHFFKGDGTPASPYQICSIYHLQQVNDDLDAHYILTQDIDASVTQEAVSDPSGTFDASGFSPIGGRFVGENQYDAFEGILDGRNHIIRGLFINSGNKYVGLFGRVGGSARIENVRLEDVDIQSRGENSGPLIAAIDGSSPGASGSPLIQNNSVAGSLDMGSFHRWAGIQIGGMIGETIDNARIFNNHSATNLSLETNTIIISGFRVQIGGFIGRIKQSGSESEVVVKGSGSSSAIAYLSSSSLPYRLYTGGLIGRISLSSGSTLRLSQSHSTGPLSGWSDCLNVCTSGGLIGLFYAGGGGTGSFNFKMTDNYSTSDMLGSSIAAYGGLIGLYYVNMTGEAEILRNYRAGVISVGKASSGDGQKSELGGLIGLFNSVSSNNNTKIRHNFATGILNDLYSTNAIDAGGLSSQFYSSYGPVYLDRNYVNLEINVTNSDGSSGVFGLAEIAGSPIVERSFFNSDSVVLNGTNITQDSGADTRCFGGDSSSNLKTLTSQSSGTCSRTSPVTYYQWHTATDINDDSTVDQYSVRYDSDGDSDIDTDDALVWDFGTTSDFPQLHSHNSNEQAVRVASALLKFSAAVTGEMVPGKHLFYDIDDSATSIDITGHGAQGTSVAYTIVDAKDGNGDALSISLAVANNSISLSGLNLNDEFTLQATFSKGAGSLSRNFIKDYRFRK